MALNKKQKRNIAIASIGVGGLLLLSRGGQDFLNDLFGGGGTGGTDETLIGGGGGVSLGGVGDFGGEGDFAFGGDFGPDFPTDPSEFAGDGGDAIGGDSLGTTDETSNLTPEDKIRLTAAGTGVVLGAELTRRGIFRGLNEIRSGRIAKKLREGKTLTKSESRFIESKRGQKAFKRLGREVTTGKKIVTGTSRLLPKTARITGRTLGKFAGPIGIGIESAFEFKGTKGAVIGGVEAKGVGRGLLSVTRGLGRVVTFIPFIGGAILPNITGEEAESIAQRRIRNLIGGTPRRDAAADVFFAPNEIGKQTEVRTGEQTIALQTQPSRDISPRETGTQTIAQKDVSGIFGGGASEGIRRKLSQVTPQQKQEVIRQSKEIQTKKSIQIQKAKQFESQRAVRQAKEIARKFSGFRASEIERAIRTGKKRLRSGRKILFITRGRSFGRSRNR